MGGGGEKKKTNQMIAQDRAQNNAEHNQYMRAVNSGLSGSQGRAGDMYNVMFGGYKDFAEGKHGFDPSKYDGAVRGGGEGGGGGDSRFGDVENSYRNFMSGGGVDTGQFNRFQGHLMDVAGDGGWDAGRRASMDQNIGMFKDIARTGGVDAEGVNRMRGGGVFDEFSRTGGLSDGDRQNIRQRATSVIPSIYSRMRDETSRLSAVQGGYGPGRSAAMARMGRDQASAAQQAALDAELGITDKVNQGRQWGSSNMASSEGALQTLLSRNKLDALQGASSTEANMLNSIAANRTGAASAGGSNETGMQSVIQQGKMFGTQGLEGMAESAAARGAAGAAAAAADAKWRAEFDREGRMYGLDSMQSLYGNRPGEVAMYLDANLAGRGLHTGTQRGVYDARMANNPQRDWLSTIGGIAGAAGGAMTGLGNLGFGRARGRG